MTDEEKNKAFRLARAIASDIALYNEAKIKSGIENDTFFESLADELDVAREHYRSRVGEEVFEKANYFDRAIVDLVLARKGHLRSKIW